MVEKRSKDGKYVVVENPNGPSLGFSPDSGVKIIEKDGLYFKDLAKTGELLPYEDWRLSADERAKDLASRLSIEQIAGLMLYSPHQMVPGVAMGPFPSTYGGKSLEESGEKPWALSDQQKEFLEKDGIRHVLAMRLGSAEIAARWNNEMQAFCESKPLGLPVNTSSDPRHGAHNSGAEYKSGGNDVSKWPEGLGMSATFSPELCRRFAEIASKEYRAMGIATALSPQIDLATEPRWMRFGDTFGEHSKLSADMARAYCDGMQTTDGAPNGWGADSVNAMAKHWPGGGTCEGGRDAHYAWGKYSVYPGNNFEEHLKPFVEGAFKLDGATGKTAAIMPYYTISWGIDTKNGKNVGNSYSEYMIKDLLRGKYGYDGVVCTDWGITGEHKGVEGFGSKCWGMETVSEAEQHLTIIMNGVDQFGGNASAKPVLEAYSIGCERYGRETMDARFRESAVRLLKNSFRCGLFENPYLDAEESKELVGCESFCREGYDAQLKSIILLKNKDALLPLDKKTTKVYVPARHIDSTMGFMRWPEPARDFDPVPRELLEKYFTVVDTPEEADVGLVFVETPITNPYDADDAKNGGNGYLPVSLQFRPYTAEKAREHSIAGGDPFEPSNDRNYRGKTVRAANERDLDNILETKKRMGSRPVVVVAELNKPLVPAEFEASADAIVAHFGVQAQAVLDILTGAAEPSALLPTQLPKDMDTVETQLEDVPFDMTPYTDECGNTYDFGFGLNWSGRISDERTERYKR